MKRYIIYTISFIFLFVLLLFSVEVMTGIILTSIYTPDVNEAWNASVHLHREIELYKSSNSFSFTVSVVILSGTVAYFITQTISRQMYNDLK